MKHKHYDCIVAWAEGKPIEVFDGENWFECIDNSRNAPAFDVTYEYRIKKEPVIEVKYFIIQVPLSYPQTAISYLEIVPDLERYDLKITYEDGKAVKAELSE